MNEKLWDPLRLDVASLTAHGGELAGAWPLEQLPRLADSAMLAESAGARVQWHVRGESRPVTGGSPEMWLHMAADVRMALCCQRCLGPVQETVGVDHALRFVHGEAQAAELDAEQEDDVLALERWTDLRVLVEDELLLALPLVPRHEACPMPLPLSDPAQAGGREDDAPHPFAALAKLKKVDEEPPPTSG